MASGSVVGYYTRPPNSTLSLPFLEEAREDVDALEHVVHRFRQFVVTRELGPLAFHPFDQIVHQWSDVFAARGHPRFGRRAVDRTLQHENGIELLNRLE